MATEESGRPDAELALAPGDMRWWRDAKFGLFLHWGVYAFRRSCHFRENNTDREGTMRRGARSS
jgi:hypothetical protein